MTIEEAIEYMQQSGKICHQIQRNSPIQTYYYIKDDQIIYKHTISGVGSPVCKIQEYTGYFVPSDWKIFDDTFDRFLAGVKLL